MGRLGDSNQEAALSHEAVHIRQGGANVRLRNAAKMPDYPVAGSLGEGECTLYRDQSLVGEYWSVEKNSDSRGSLFLELDRHRTCMVGK